ncbi:endonuclease I family protein [Priestia megaterium]|uniref:endonuclease I family protein n=1 Tax=Priestia megaterium TaxID=1404 RepID=UPI002FFF8BC9
MRSSLDMLMMEKQQAKALYHEYANNRSYYDEKTDEENKNLYYQDTLFEREAMQTLLKETHQHLLSYSPHKYVYPWVDLQENGELKSLYSGKGMDPLETIQQDIDQLHSLSNSSLSSNDILLNCEHVVPQSWFGKQEPMRGDLHHLFACEPSCNSRRGNSSYIDFPDYTPEVKQSDVKEGCGKAEKGKFEPEYGKGIVARSTLYFLIRYHNKIDSSRVDLPLLLKWHEEFTVSLYEKHRNAAIFELQGNRNPFIDFPDKAAALINSAF